MLKKLFKNRIFLCVFTALIVGTTSVYAVTYFPSNQVTYENSSSGLKSSDVQGAIDELYSTCESCSSKVVGDYIYFTGYKTEGNTPTLYKVSINGGSPTSIPITYENKGTRSYGINNFAIIDDMIYFTGYKTEGNTPTLYKVSINGGSPTSIPITYENGGTRNYGINNFAIIDDMIYFTGYRSNSSSQIPHLYKVSINGGSPTSIPITYENGGTRSYGINNFIFY